LDQWVDLCDFDAGVPRKCRLEYYSAITTDLVFVRLHRHESTYASSYTDDSLAIGRTHPSMAERRT
jgi:hypothetical protein